MPLTNEILKKYVTETFVETGSYLGDGIEAARQVGFDEIISIELSGHYLEHCKNRFVGDSRVKLVRGDSAIVLKEVIGKITGRMTFWLDGHCSCGKTAKGIHWSPLMQELEQIPRHHRNDHIIMVDDMRCWIKENPVIGFGKDEIIAALKRINPRYQFQFEDVSFAGQLHVKDILVAIPPEVVG